MVQWFCLFAVGAALGAVLAVAVMAPNRRYAVRVGGAVLGAAGLLVVSVLLWRHLLTALTIAALFALALGVLFQKVPPSKAMGAALAALLLVFAFTWLTLRLNEVFLLGPREQPFSLVQQWLENASVQVGGLGGLDSTLLLVVGLAALAAGALLEARVRALAVFAGLLLVGLWARAAFPGFGPALAYAPIFRDPLVQGALVAVVVAGFMHWLFTTGKPGDS